MDDADLRELVHEMNLSAAQIARRAADRSRMKPDSRFVAGSLGPLPVTASISPDVNDPSFRAVTFDQIRQTYFDQAKACSKAVSIYSIVETIFDTLNAKAALVAIAEALRRNRQEVPLMISGTVTDRPAER